ncbi:MAG: lipocalin family protein [Actinobacteria bacterium]|nr:MAG: lipocalin family protein [Actinomycetota bacterium]
MRCGTVALLLGHAHDRDRDAARRGRTARADGRVVVRPPVGRLPRRPACVRLGLVLVPLRRRDGADALPVPRPGATGVTSFDITAGPRTLDAAGHSWPLDWTLNVPSLSLSESLSAIVPDQLVRNTIIPTFWEGASTATGSRTGTCFVELSYP